MSSGVHFTLDNLPERYRTQVAQKLSSGVGGINTRQPSTEGVEGCSRSSGAISRGPLKGRRTCGCVRQHKVSEGMNKTETLFQKIVLKDAGIYEGLTFKVALGVKYTPDFIVFDETGHITAYEVKGSYALPSQGRARTAFLACREKYPQVTFRWFKSVRTGHFVEDLIEG